MTSEVGGVDLSVDAMGEVLFHLVDGLVPFNGRTPTHPHWRVPLAFDIAKGPGGLRQSLTLADVVGGAVVPDHCVWRNEQAIAQLHALVRTVVRDMLRCARVSRGMARLILPHWRRLYDVTRVAGVLDRSAFLLPRDTTKTPLPPRLPAAWYRLAVIRFLVGQWSMCYKRVLRTGYYRMAPTFLALPTAWETADRVMTCGLLGTVRRRRDEPGLDEWRKNPVYTRDWLRERYEARRATERHAAAFRRRLEVLWRRGQKGRDDEVSEDDWHY